MPELTDSAPRPRAWPLATFAVLSASALTLVFAHALAAYWHFYHLGSPGTGFLLVLLVVPGGFAISINVVFFVARALVRRGLGIGRGLAMGSLAAAVLFALLLTLEIWRTAALRSGEGLGAGALAPYFLYHLRILR